MVRRLIWWQKARRSPPFPAESKDPVGLSGISTSFEVLSQIIRQIIYALLTRAPLIEEQAPQSVRLACVRHAASVRSEPGSNSPVCTEYSLIDLHQLKMCFWHFFTTFRSLDFCYSVFKDQLCNQTNKITKPFQSVNTFFSEAKVFFGRGKNPRSKGTRFLT